MKIVYYRSVSDHSCSFEGDGQDVVSISFEYVMKLCNHFSLVLSSSHQVVAVVLACTGTQGLYVLLVYLYFRSVGQTQKKRKEAQVIKEGSVNTG